ncbi:MAG: carboxylesterase family protein [Lachnospiraceae bacterium]|nr:carboxylesterase family protein [Lachnospiraceae bacterium]
MIFNILMVLVTFIYLVVLELSKNTIIGWIVGIVLCLAGIIGRLELIKHGIYARRYGLFIWAAFFILLIVNYIVTAPLLKRLPAVDNKNPEVTEVIKITQGELTGVYNKDKTVRVYAGIPYAKPPIGELRFKEPQSPDAWEGVKKCDKFGPMAMQARTAPFMDSLLHIFGWHDYRVRFGDEYIEDMSEDCLYLNVFAPEEKSDELLPVLFYVHGGSLTTGQSSYSEYRGEDLAKRGIIVVNFAYRLGPFGYYAAEDLAAESANHTTGNYGLLDQIAALQWVYDNIEAFGGDKNRITIAGESAGSSSVNAMCVSPLTEGLFDYAIAESSGIAVKKPFHTFRSFEEAINEGNKMREEFNVTSSDALRDIPAEKLIQSKTTHSSMTVDGYAITEMPYITYEKGLNHEKALLNGYNAKEADVFMMTYEATSENYIKILSQAIGDYAKKLAEVIPVDTPQRDQHFIIDKLGDAKGAVNTAYSALWFSYSHFVWNRYLVAQGRPAYEYCFMKTNNSLSNYHAGELPYLYGNLWRHDYVYDEEDFKLSDIMQQYVVNFVKTGNPNGDGLPAWDAVDSGVYKLLKLDTTIEMIEDPNMAVYRVIDEYQNAE